MHKSCTSLQWVLLLACTLGYMGENLNCWPGDKYCDNDASLLDALVQFRARDCGANFTRDVRHAKQDNKPFSAFGVPVSEIKDLTYFLRTSYEVFGCELPGVPFDGDGLIRLPDTITRIKIDVGLGHHAPNTQLWLESIPGLVVFGFEPNLQAVSDMLAGRRRGQSIVNAKHLDLAYVGRRMFLFPVALGISLSQADFYATKNSVCSSILEPNIEWITQHDGQKAAAEMTADVYPVAVLTLSDLLSKIPWGSEGDPGVFPIVEHIKIDAQGYDLEILRGAGPYLSQRVVCVTAEKSAWGYKEPGHNAQELIDFMSHQGFTILHESGLIRTVLGVVMDAGDLTFYNTNLSDWLNDIDCSGGDSFVT
jgi:hypothetical protein